MDSRVDLDQRLAGVLEAVLGPDARDLSDDDGPGTISSWDSVNHLNLVLAIEAEFEIRFATSEIPDLLSVGKIRARLGRG
ncbi:MAG: acyl carrier protein [Gemmatimonadota bacterium]